MHMTRREKFKQLKGISISSVLVGREPEYTEQYATILYYPSETITNAYILSAILPTKTIVRKRPDISCRHFVANRISAITEITKPSYIKNSIVKIDTAIGQCPYQPTKINHRIRYFVPIPKYFRRLFNFSLWNSQSLNNKISIFVDSLLTDESDISIVTKIRFNSCDDTAEGRFKTACKGFHILYNPREGEEVAVLLLCQNLDVH